MNPTNAVKVKMKHIIGNLYASNKEAAADAFVRHRLYYSFTENGLSWLVNFDSKWSDNNITFNSSSPTAGTVTEAVQLIENLNIVMNTEDALRLGFNGRFSMVVDSVEEPLVFRIEVQGGEVSYQQAKYGWPEKVII